MIAKRLRPADVGGGEGVGERAARCRASVAAAATAAARSLADRCVEGAAVAFEARRRGRARATRAAAESMIMFSSLYGGMPDGIGRAGLSTAVGSKRGSSEIRRWQVWQSKK